MGTYILHAIYSPFVYVYSSVYLFILPVLFGNNCPSIYRKISGFNTIYMYVPTLFLTTFFSGFIKRSSVLIFQTDRSLLRSRINLAATAPAATLQKNLRFRLRVSF